MHIHITADTPLSEIQRVFSQFYPFLKIEFFSKRHKKYEGSTEDNQIDPGTLVGDIKHNHVPGMLEVKALYKVFDVEREFQQHFGLSVQIFRKEKEDWQQSTGTDDFTLKDLNELGKDSSDEYIIDDYEEGFEEPEEKPEKLF
jgi:hypothetical protein